ncbi:flavodoxin reductase [candidate division WWE3 bacterium]|uniref:Flavodoxin reductase n=1 Tax=candidate division WWE3 bacterium TaxID=2053526 RepID=A0A955RRG6_UNCKA|nr:flavodoxin reductase [candidate division WWE3 bacterium]
MPYTVEILQVQQVTHDVKRFVVTKPDGYSFTSGQAADVSIRQPGWEDNLHAFTFTSLNEDEVLEFVIKGYLVADYPKHQGVTEKIHSLVVGDELLISDPWGTITYKGKGVFIAGGAGITPFISIFRDLHKKGGLSGNTLVFSNKTEADVILEQELIAMFDPEHLIFTLTRQRLAGYEYGRVDGKFLQDRGIDFSQYFYLCGPRPMVNDLRAVLSEFGANVENMVFEE